MASILHSIVSVNPFVRPFVQKFVRSSGDRQDRAPKWRDKDNNTRAKAERPTGASPGSRPFPQVQFIPVSSESRRVGVEQRDAAGTGRRQQH